MLAAFTKFWNFCERFLPFFLRTQRQKLPFFYFGFKQQKRRNNKSFFSFLFCGSRKIFNVLFEIFFLMNPPNKSIINREKVLQLLFFKFWCSCFFTAVNCEKEDSPSLENFTQSFFHSLTLSKWNKKYLWGMLKSWNSGIDCRLSIDEMKSTFFFYLLLVDPTYWKNFGGKLIIKKK